MNESTASHFEAEIARQVLRGETFYWARIRIGGRQVFSVPELSSEQAAQLAVLEWAQRTGKQNVLKWSYPQGWLSQKTMKQVQSNGRSSVAHNAALMDAGGIPGVVSLERPGLRLSGEESRELLERETRIEKGIKGFLEVGVELLAIREKRLYRAMYDTFEKYCLKRWGFGDRRGRQLSDAAEVVQQITGGSASHSESETGTIVPTAESQVRPLTALAPEQRKEAWDEAVSSAPDHKPTAKDVQAAVDKRKWPQPNAQGVYPEKGAERLRFAEGPIEVEILVLQVGKEQWVSANSYQFHLGDSRGSSGLLRPFVKHATRENAIRFEVEDLVRAMRRVNKRDNSCVSKGQEPLAQKAIEWAKGLVEAEARTAKPQEFVLQTEVSNKRDYDSSLPGKDRTEELAKSVGWMVAQLQKMEADIFAVVVDPYHYIRALDHLDCLRERLQMQQRKETTASKQKPTKGTKKEGFEYVIVRRPMKGSVNIKPRFAPGWGGIEKATRYKSFEEAQEHAKDDEVMELGKAQELVTKPAKTRTKNSPKTGLVYLICRDPRPDVVGEKPKYWSGPNAWTIDPSRAKRLSEAQAKARLVKTGKWESCKTDKMVPLEKAVKRFGA